VEEVLGRVARIVKSWTLVNKQEDVAKLDAWASDLEKIYWNTTKVDACDIGVIELW
jgi:hypothetical protein